MEISPLTLVPAAAAVLYATLLVVVRRRAAVVDGLTQFQILLALLVISSVTSVAWHSTGDPRVSDMLLRVLTWSDMSVAPALLAFVAARRVGPRSPVARRTALAVAAAIVLVAVSGSMSRAILVPVPEPGMVDRLVAYAAVLVGLATYLAAAGYLVYSYRGERDPFERNQLKYLGIATLLILCGLLTNLVSTLQQYPIDRSLAVAASFIIFFSLIRYRLFDIDLVLKRAFLTGGSVALVAPAYLVALFAIGAVRELTAPVLFLVGMAMLPPAVLASHLLRHWLQRLADRLFLGLQVDSDVAAADFVVRAQQSRSTPELAELVSAVCQHHLEARFVAVLLRNSATDQLDTMSVRGPLAGLHASASIDLDNRLLASVAESGEPVAPFRMSDFAGVASKREAAQLEPFTGCVIQSIGGRDELIGLVVVGERVYDGAYSLSDLRLLSAIAAQAALAIESVRMFEQIQAHANTDFLTGLPNHRHLQDLLLDKLARAESHDEPFAVAMVDVDNFKLLNDTHGHVAGDDALRKVAGFLRGRVREGDIVGRYGGDEFLLIFPGADAADAAELLTRIARDARRISLTTGDSEWSAAPRIPMRLSWGTASYPDHAMTARTLVAAADSDLMKRRYVRRRSGHVHTDRPSLRHLGERDPRRVRIASGLLELLDTKDNYTTEHSQQVASLGLLLADELGLSDEDREDLWLGGLLHDIGKLNVPDEVLRKPGTLNDADWALIHEHPVQGELLARGLFGDGPLTEIIGCHHERHDGRGYPLGLAGERIPRLARAVSVCDAYSAMVHDRPYRKGLTPAEAIAELRAGAGTQWDAEMVDAFARAVGRDEPFASEVEGSRLVG